jgi:hypothetical protein
MRKMEIKKDNQNVIPRVPFEESEIPKIVPCPSELRYFPLFSKRYESHMTSGIVVSRHYCYR